MNISMPGKLLLGAALAIVGTTALAQAVPIIKQNFEDSDGGWMVVGQGGKVSITHDADDVKSGKAALKLEYNIQKGDMSALLYPTPDGMLAKAKSLRFWVKSDTGGILAAALQEQGGGRYVSFFTAPAGKWQQVELAISDFVLSEDANDPPDPNGKLDLDKVDGIAITDIGQILGQADNPDIEKLFSIKRGAHSLFVDDFVVTEDPLAGPATDPGTLDNFARPQIGWMLIGGIKAVAVTGAPLTGKGLQLDYHQSFGKPTGIIRKVPRGTLVGKNIFSVDIASAKPAKLLFQVEEKGGGKYNVLMDVAGGKTLKTITLPFSEFKAADDSKDTNDKLDLDQVNQVLILDVNALLNMTEGDNTLWVGNIKAIQGKVDK